jgi:general secretion pathway protein G
MKRPTSRRDRGFTLIEVLLVLVILVVLASLATVNILSAQKKAKINSAKVQVELLDKALQTYYLDVGSFPSASVGLQALRVESPDVQGTNKWAGPYLDRDIPADPWGKPYEYMYPPRMNRDKPDISTVSPDNQVIGNWSEEMK